MREREPIHTMLNCASLRNSKTRPALEPIPRYTKGARANTAPFCSGLLACLLRCWKKKVFLLLFLVVPLDFSNSLGLDYIKAGKYFSVFLSFKVSIVDFNFIFAHF